MKSVQNTNQSKNRAFLVGVDLRREEDFLSVDDSLSELALLSETAGLEVVGMITQRLDAPNPKTFIGTGKVEEVIALVGEVQADVVVFDEELSGRHLRELEKLFGERVRILDRTALILDIFAQHADTREGSLQVELAQYQYRLTRLTRAWTHLARQAGGGGGRSGASGGVGLRGPGETQLEVDRRIIQRRIGTLKSQIEKVRTHRQQYRIRRKRSKIPIVALVGYTNAGKSTLLNYLTGAEVYVADQLFATLDPTTRRVEFPGGQVALFTDTVGFIQKLPTTLIAAFRATLEEITEADLLLHVIDVTHPNAHAQSRAVFQTLEEIEADHVPIISALNKIDLLEDSDGARRALEEFPKAVAISARTGEGVDDLLKSVNQLLFENFVPVLLWLPYREGGLISMFHEQGHVEKVEHGEEGIQITGMLPQRLVARFSAYKVQNV
ncbi:MAG: GTPase HflX [Anaerolineales bacterium]|nr:GTPase HflX [Anaerolineales bacterium]